MAKGQEGAEAPIPSASSASPPLIIETSCKYARYRYIRPMTPNAAAIGPRIRTLRLVRGLTMADLAARTGVSEATLSRIETGLSQVSAPHLYGLAAHLGVDIASFFVDATQPGSRAVTRAAAGSGFDSPRLSARLLAADLRHKSMHPFLNTVSGTELDQVGGLISHAGEEFLYVLSGHLVLHSASYASLTLAPGDSLYFDARDPHAYLALNEPATFLVVSSAPLNP